MFTQLATLHNRSGRQPSPGYIPALDGVRAIGIVLVFIHHAISPIQFGGQVGVDVFFVLSGYLITAILLTERSRTSHIGLKKFYLRRAVRLFPALLVVVLVLAIPGAIFAPSLGKYLLENVLAVTYTTPLALQVTQGAAWAWRHTWSLGIEEMFYLVWPLLIKVVLREGRERMRLAILAFAGGLLLLFAAVALDVTGHPGSLLLRSGGLFLGCALAVFLRRNPLFQFPPLVGWSGLALIGAAVVLATYTSAESVAVLITCTGSAFLIGHVVQNRGTRLIAALSAKPVAYVGSISYELYLWHFPLLVIFAWAFHSDLIGLAWIAAPLSIGLAAATHAILTPLVGRWKERVSNGRR